MNNPELKKSNAPAAMKARRPFVAPVLKKHEDLPLVTAGSIQIVNIVYPMHRTHFH